MGPAAVDVAALERSEDSVQFRYRGTQLANCEQNLKKLNDSADSSIRVRELQGLFLELGRPFEAIGRFEELPIAC